MNLIQKYTAVVTHKDPERTEGLQTQLGRLSKMEMDQLYAGSPTGGHAFLMHSPGSPACVLETVVSTEGQGDSISALYVGIPLFAERAQYLRAREELIAFINDVSGDQLVRCHSRCRFVRVKELCLAQLIDVGRQLLERFEGKNRTAH